jgi:hypothetical protein
MCLDGLEQAMNQTPQMEAVIDEVREVRHRISARCGHDPERLVAYYLELQKQYKDRLLGAEKPPAHPNQPAA